MKYHLSYRRLRAEREGLSCRRVVLTHLGPDMLAHAADSEFECADDGTVIRL